MSFKKKKNTHPLAARPSNSLTKKSPILTQKPSKIQLRSSPAKKNTYPLKRDSSPIIKEVNKQTKRRLILMTPNVELAESDDLSESSPSAMVPTPFEDLTNELHQISQPDMHEDPRVPSRISVSKRRE